MVKMDEHSQPQENYANGTLNLPVFVLEVSEAWGEK